jgi:glycosyltransferase involved in cell wall biosynthesis
VLRISVVVPFRDEERHIGRCLAALENQESFAGDHETVVVADRSTDGSAAIVRRFPRVRLIEARTSGPYGARNAGVRETEGDLIAFTDADCKPARDWLRRIAEALDGRNVEVAVGPRLTGADGFLLSLVTAYEKAKDQYVFGGGHSDLYYASANKMAVRRRIWKSSAASKSGGVEETRSSFGGSRKRARRRQFPTPRRWWCVTSRWRRCGTTTASASHTARACAGSAAREGSSGSWNG